MMGVMMEVIARPAVWILERLGLTVRVVHWFAGRMHKRMAARNPFRGYAPTHRDVFVATYIKSGTNWMMQLAHQLLTHGNGDYEHIHSVIPWPDTTNGGPMRHYAIPLQDDSVWKASPEQKRVIKTHFNWELLPYSPDARYITVIRDPKDVFVSSYHFLVKEGDRTWVSVETWLKLFLSEQFPMWGSWAANTANYWAERHRPNVLIVSFKSMKRDLGGTVRKVADLLDVRVDDELIERVSEKSSFAYMKTIDDKFSVWKMTPWGYGRSMIRKGAQGGSAEILTLDQQQQIDEYFIAELRRLGSDFPYEEFCDLARRPAFAPSDHFASSPSAQANSLS